MKLTDMFKSKKMADVKVEESSPAIIPLKVDQSYKDLIYEELGGNVRAVKAEIEEFDKEFNRISGVLEKQGHLVRDVKDKDRFGNEISKDSWSTKAEEIFAPRRRKAESLKLKLEKAENELNAKAFKLFSMAETLDNIKYIKYRESVYKLAAIKINELIPLIEDVNRNKFDISLQHGENVALSSKWEQFVRTFEGQNPGYVDEAALKVRFYEEFARVKAEFEKVRELEELKI